MFHVIALLGYWVTNIILFFNLLMVVLKNIKTVALQELLQNLQL
jgi:hypothetical protein